MPEGNQYHLAYLAGQEEIGDNGIMTTQFSKNEDLKASFAQVAGLVFLILCTSLGSKLGQWVFSTSDNVRQNAVSFTAVFALLLIAVVNHKGIIERPAFRKFPLWSFFVVFGAAFLLTILFKFL